MTFVDTSHLIALLNPRDSLHSRSMRWSAVVSEPLVLTEYVVLETVNYFSRPQHRAQAQAFVRFVRSDASYEVVPITRQLFESGLALHAARNDKAWSLTDCISFEVMRERGIRDALTFDEHFDQAGFRALLRSDPMG